MATVGRQRSRHFFILIFIFPSTVDKHLYSMIPELHSLEGQHGFRTGRGVGELFLGACFVLVKVSDPVFLFKM